MLIKIFRPRSSLYPRNVMIYSGIHARYDAAAKSSETSNPNYGVRAIMVRVKNGKWSSAVTLE